MGSVMRFLEKSRRNVTSASSGEVNSRLNLENRWGSCAKRSLRTSLPCSES